MKRVSGSFTKIAVPTPIDSVTPRRAAAVAAKVRSPSNCYWRTILISEIDHVTAAAAGTNPNPVTV